MTKKSARILERERHEGHGNALAALVMKLYIAFARNDHKPSEHGLNVNDFSSATWTNIAAGLIAAGWRPPLAWEPPQNKGEDK